MSRGLSIAFFTAVIFGFNVDPAAAQSRPLHVVDSLDIVRYAGKWYEVARLPNAFQKDCVSDVTAKYTIRSDGELEVVNQCVKEDLTVSRSEGVARHADGDLPNSVMEVRFAPGAFSFLPSAWADYWVLGIEGDYDYALVGTPDRRYLWVLAREPQFDEEVLAMLLQHASRQGYDIDDVKLTLHIGDPRT